MFIFMHVTVDSLKCVYVKAKSNVSTACELPCKYMGLC